MTKYFWGAFANGLKQYFDSDPGFVVNLRKDVLIDDPVSNKRYANLGKRRAEILRWWYEHNPESAKIGGGDAEVECGVGVDDEEECDG